jgi:hypothetical protein
MWILNFIPDSIINFIVYGALFLGLFGITATYFLSAIPLMGKYILPIRIISFIVLLVSIYFLGGISVEENWQNRIKELEEKIEIAEQKSQAVNTVIEEKVITKIKIQKEYVDVIKREVEIQKEVIDKDCSISNEAIKYYNKALEEVK